MSLPKDTVIDSVALNDTADPAFVAHWSDNGKERTAVFTSKRIVAMDGEAVDGKFILRINGASLAINTAGTVAYEATYTDGSGIFLERKFVAPLTGAGAANDFTLTEDGRIIAREGVTVVPATPVAAVTVEDTPENQSQQRSGIFGPYGLPAILQKKLGGYIPVFTPPTVPPPSAAKTKAVKAKAAPAPQPPVKDKVCQVPAFPTPPEWLAGTSAKGPIHSSLFDPPANGRVYESQWFKKMSAPFRSIQFSSDCVVLFIAIGDKTDPGRFEFWTPDGLLTLTTPEGTLDLPGIADALPGALGK
jgi:hypothetical protein